MAPVSDLVSLFRLWSTLRRLRPELTEFSTPKAGLLGNIAAFLCRVPTRIYLLRGLRLETASGLKQAVLKATERVASACAHTVLCNSGSLQRQAHHLHLARRAKLRTIAEGSSNGVDTGRFFPGPGPMRQNLGLPPGAPVIGYVGRLTRDKGIPELLDGFDLLLETLPDAWLLLVGWFDASEDALSAQQRRRIEAHPRILHTGFVTDTSPYYRAIDVLVLPTWREGFPNVALEAAATGIPVITTNTTGARDAVLPGITGLLVAPGEPRQLAHAMRELLLNGQMRRAMGHAARRWAVEHFSRDRVLAQTVAVYAALLKDGANRAVLAPVRDAAPAVE